MKKMMLSISMALGLVYGAQAYSVTENFGGDHSSGYVTTDHVEYRVVVASGQTLGEFRVAYGLGAVPAPSAFYAKNSSGVDLSSGPGGDFLGGGDNGLTGTRGAFTADGIVGSTATACEEL